MSSRTPQAMAGPSASRRSTGRTLIANKDKEIARLEAAYTANLTRSKVEIVKTRAVLEDAHTVRLLADDRRVRAKHILIATGGWPGMGTGIAGIEHVISSNEAFHLAELPKRILIQGGGYIAVEFACIFAGLGSEVTLVYRGDNILRGFDDDVRAHLRSEMERRGIKVICKRIVEAVEKVDHGLCVELSDHDDIVVDKVMFATGRRPNVEGLGLEAAGVKLNDKGAIAVDEFSRTSVPHIYAVGDVTDRLALTPVAIREGHAFADTRVRREADRGRPRQRADRGVLRAGDRRDRTDRDAGARALPPRRYLQDDLPPDEDRVRRQRGPHADEAHRGRRDRPRARLSHRRAGCGRDDPGARHRHQDGRDQGRFRRHHGGASDRGRRARDACAP